MTDLVLSGTYNGSALKFVSSVSDLKVLHRGGDTFLFASTGAGGGATGFNVTSSGDIAHHDQIAYSYTVMASPTAQIALVDIDGQPYFLPYGSHDWTLDAYALNQAGEFGSSIQFDWGPDGVGNLSALETVSLGGQTHVFAANAQSTGFSHYVRTPQNLLELAHQMSAVADTNTSDVVDMEVVRTGETHVLLTLSTAANGISSYRLNKDGTPTQIDALSAANNLPISAPSALTTGHVLNKSFAVIASAGSSSLTIVELDETGNLIPTDHVLDNRWTRFSNVTEIASAQVGEALYIAAAGADDGVSLFTLLPNGMLVHLDTIWDTQDSAMQNISALAMAYVAGHLRLFATSETERGITVLDYDLAKAGVTLAGDGTTNVLQGTQGDDQIDGGMWSEVIRGDGGNDILRDGVGEDRLSGGAGADMFILAADGMVDTIEDFQPDSDRLNLTEFHMLYDVSQLQITSKPWGAEIAYRGDITKVYSANGQALDASHFSTFDTLRLNRPPNGFQYIPETIYGTDADDVFGGDEGTETIYGLAGNDLFIWSAGADVFHGGDGIDTASYANAPSAVTINLQSRLSSGAADGDLYHSIEWYVGSFYADTLIGNGESNIFVGGSGNDVLEGRGGGDHLDGGPGLDTASYAWARAAVTVNLSTGSHSGAASGDTLISIENVRGTSYHDRLTGNSANNRLLGQIGNDILFGGAGNDELFGGSGNDVLAGGAGGDFLHGGAGDDWADYRAANIGVHIDLLMHTAGAGAVGDTLISIEHLYGSSQDDILGGDDTANTIAGRNGNDSVYGRAGNDILKGGDGDDRLYGQQGDDWIFGGYGIDILSGGSGSNHLYGSDGNDQMIDGGGRDRYDGGGGFDQVDYSSRPSAVQIGLTSGKGYGAALGDRYHSVEGIVGSRFSDAIYGNGSSNRLFGGDGNDRLYGSYGKDTLVGQNGQDWLQGGTGNDHLIGGQGGDILKGEDGRDRLKGGAGSDYLHGGRGSDIADYSDDADGVYVNLTTNRNRGAATGDILHSIERVTGTEYGDVLVGDRNSNTLRGERGDDLLNALGGNDYLFGGEGNDRLVAYSGRDYLNGGTGIDLLDLSKMTSGATIWLFDNKGGESMSGDRIYAIENVLGTRYNDRLYGDDQNNKFYGSGGHDRENGKGGNDYLYGNNGNDNLYGDDGDDRLFGGHGRDILNGARGNDRLCGGSNVDTFFYQHGQDIITDFEPGVDKVRLSSALQSGTLAGSDRLSSIAEVQDGGLLLDFGGGHTLFFEGVGSFAELEGSVLWY